MRRPVGEIFIVPLTYSITGYHETRKGETPDRWGVYRQGDGFVESVEEYALTGPETSKCRTKTEAIAAAARARLKG